jgi:hypothetical protein
MSTSTWIEPSGLNTGFTRDQWMLMNSGGQTALNIGRISEDAVLTKNLISRGANLDIHPINKELVEEFQITGEYI